MCIRDRKDSVGICFVGERNMKDFLGRFINLTKGPIIDEYGVEIGEHDGATLYTKGQRQGLNIGGLKGKEDLPWYVFDKDIKKNEVYVCQGIDNELLFSKYLECEKISWINEIEYVFPKTCLIQVRHQHTPVECKIFVKNKKFTVEFIENIRGVAPGQSAVFYDKNLCLGGGIISKSA